MSITLGRYACCGVCRSAEAEDRDQTTEILVLKPPPLFCVTVDSKGDEALCFHTLLQVLILKELSSLRDFTLFAPSAQKANRYSLRGKFLEGTNYSADVRGVLKKANGGNARRPLRKAIGGVFQGNATDGQDRNRDGAADFG